MLAWLVSCAPQPALHSAPPPISTSGVSGVSTSGASTPLPRVPRAPSARVLGVPDSEDRPALDLGADVFVLPATTNEPSMLLLGGNGGQGGYPDLPATFVVPGLLPPGDHEVLDVAVGRLIDVDVDSSSAAGDNDGDGHADVWLGARLYAGPFDRVQSTADAVAWLSEEYSVSLGADADGDGAMDLLSLVGAGFIFYGPFSGRITVPEDPTALSDPSSQSAFFAGSGYLARMSGYGGPGQDGFLSGFGEYDYGAIYLYTLPIPRGIVIDDAGGWDSVYINGGISIAELYDIPAMQPVGDVDGDGYGDALFAYSFHQIGLGPFVGAFGTGDIRWLANGPGTTVSAAVGDVNGDDATDLVATCDGWVWLLLSPHLTPLDACLGLPLALLYEQWPGHSIGAFSGDLDGDSRSDIGARLSPGEDGIAVWYANDLLAAEAARTQRHP